MRRILKRTLIIGAALTALTGSADAQGRMLRLSHAELKDRIRGGWAGQTIGVTFGGPTEFRYNGSMINDQIPIRWYDGYLKETYERSPGLYDDLYVDLTFVDVLERKGLDAKAQDFADALANAGYMLRHANQVARYNVLNGLQPPASGHWLNNPEADALDFQIEADFIGLMTSSSRASSVTIRWRSAHCARISRMSTRSTSSSRIRQRAMSSHSTMPSCMRTSLRAQGISTPRQPAGCFPRRSTMLTR